MVAPWDIYAEKLFPLGYGHPLWVPEPSREFGEVRVGDIGYLSNGRLCFMFNCTRPADDPVNVRGTPVGFQPLDVPSGAITETPNEITQPLLQSEGIHSISFEGQGAVGLVDNPVIRGSAEAGLRYRCTEQSGALLMLKQSGHGTRMHCTLNIQTYMRKYLPSWHAFATESLGIDLQESDIIFVYGHTKTTIWAEAAFSSKNSDGELYIAGGFGSPANVGASGAFSASLSNAQLPMLFHRSGPQGRASTGSTSQTAFGVTGDPNMFDQCIFLNYFKMKRALGLRRTILRAAAGPHQLPKEGDDAEPSDLCAVETEIDEDVGQSLDNRMIFDPATQVLDYILQHSEVQGAWASDQDVVQVMKHIHKQEISPPSSTRTWVKAAIDSIFLTITAVDGLGALSWTSNSAAADQRHLPKESSSNRSTESPPFSVAVASPPNPQQAKENDQTPVAFHGGIASPTIAWRVQLNSFLQDQRRLTSLTWHHQIMGPRYHAICTATLLLDGVEYACGCAATFVAAEEIAAEKAMRMLKETGRHSSY